MSHAPDASMPDLFAAKFERFGGGDWACFIYDADMLDLIGEQPGEGQTPKAAFSEALKEANRALGRSRARKT